VLPMSLDSCVCGFYHLSCVLCTLCYLCLWTVVCVVFIIDKDHTHNGPET
jgi:hypothetical protein